MCPATSKYIHNEYLDSASNLPVRVNGTLEKEIITKAKKVLALQRQGKKLIFPDITKIESELIKSPEQNGSDWLCKVPTSMTKNPIGYAM